MIVQLSNFKRKVCTTPDKLRKVFVRADFRPTREKTGEIKPIKTKASNNRMLWFEYIIIVLDKFWIPAFASLRIKQPSQSC